MSTLLGLSFGAHDAATALVGEGEILFASHNERYSRKKNDPEFSAAAVDDALTRGDDVDTVVYYERPWLTVERQVGAGQLGSARDHPSWKRAVKSHPRLRNAELVEVGHHLSHAAGGYYTSPFRSAVVVVVDAIGESDTITVWRGEGDELVQVASVSYPHSIGLLYSAFTQRAGYRPNEEEYILMGLSSFADDHLADVIWDDFVESDAWPEFRLRTNVHRGVMKWRPEERNAAAIAAGVQEVTRRLLDGLFRWAAGLVPSRNLVFSGGVALNCVYNDRLARSGLFDDLWIMPSPGDAGSSLGAALAYLGRHVRWRSPFLGHDLGPRADLDASVKALVEGQPIAFAQGCAEFGPRALGNRSLLADPRTLQNKARVNAIKRRHAYRPFAPAVLQEHAGDYFDLPLTAAPYMQFAVPCRRPRELLSVCHVDGSARVQTVTRDENPVFHELLSRFHEETGCPVLLNTSLNVRGEPLVNDLDDLIRFVRTYDVPAPGL